MRNGLPHAIHQPFERREKENITMRNATRTIALAAVLATVLSATTASAAEPRLRERRDRGAVAQMVKRVMKFFGVSSLAEISIPWPSNAPNPNTSTNPGTTTGQE
jgi:hypothetical protein